MSQTSNNFRLVFNLKQHTPIIHFQHDQTGATLRATELKPKLDKFLIKKMGGWSKVSPSWKIPTDDDKKQPLNYKVKIAAGAKDRSVSGSIENTYDHRGRDKVEKFPTFFGLMGEGEDGRASKEFLLHNNITVTIRSLVPELITAITSHLAEFFIRHNFGNRQSKGFGSFYPEDLSQFPISPLTFYFDVDMRKPTISRYDYLKGQPSERFFQYFGLFHTINLFYSTLRSGINQNWGSGPIYFKSLLFLYAKEKLGAQWDKKKIKEEFYNRNLRDQKDRQRNSDTLTYTSSKSYLMRDLLGLASVSKWWAEYKDTITTESKSIERFKSPIHFKPIEIKEGIFRIFFEGNQEEVNPMLNQQFEISNRNRRSFKLSTPPKFDINDYLKFAFSIDVKKHAQIKQGNRSFDFDLLDRIFSEIRTNAKL